MQTGLAHTMSDARRRGVLAFTCAVHLLALFLWTQERRLLPVRPSRAMTVLLPTDRGQAARPPAAATMLPLPPPSMPAVPAVSPSAPLPEPARRVEDDDARATRREPRVDTAPVAALPAPAPAASNPFDTAEAVDPAEDARTGARPPASVSSPQGGFALGLAKQQAGRIDRELRKGKPGVPTEADTPSARFQRGLESAYIDRSLTLQSDTYTSPDGVVIYRFRQGGRFRCRRAGGVGMPLAGMPGTGSITAASAGAAGATDCPKGVVWNQDN